MANGNAPNWQQPLLQKPDLLILDQPFVGLDTAARLNLTDLLERQMKAGSLFCDHL